MHLHRLKDPSAGVFGGMAGASNRHGHVLKNGFTWLRDMTMTWLPCMVAHCQTKPSTAPTQVMKTQTVINQLLSLTIWWMKCNLEPLGQKWLVKKHVTKILKCETPNYRTIVDANIILIKSLVIWVQPNIPVTCHTLLESQVRSLRGAVRSAQAHVKALGCRTWRWIRNLINPGFWLTLDFAVWPSPSLQRYPKYNYYN